jgi:hypothetical protein
MPLFALAPLALVALPGTAAAQSAVPCGTGFTPAEYRLEIGIDDGSMYPLDPVVGHLPYRRYDNMQKHTRKLVANKFVEAVSLRFATFETEAGWDRLTIAGAPCSGASCKTYHTLSGSPGLADRTVDYAPLGQSLQSAPLRLSFVSDATVTGKGIDVSSLAVRCMPAGVSNDLAHTLAPGETVDGVLLGGDDIVYVNLPGGLQPGFHQSVVLWGGDATTDVDLLLACGRRPTATDFDLASRTGKNQEYLEWNDGTRGACTAGWHLGIHSYPGAGKDGKGSFSLLFSRHRASQHLRLRAGFTTTSCGDGIKPEFAQRAAARAYLASASALIFGATDGQVFVDWELYHATGADNWQPLGDTWSCGGAPCNVRLAECFSGGQAYPLSDRLWIGAQWHGGDGGTMIHEFGHAHLGLGSTGHWPHGEDGYWAPLDFPGTILPAGFPSGRRDFIYNVCGHSAMSNGYLDPTARKYCTSHNHMRNQRYVQVGWETNVLTSNGLLDSEPGASATGYAEPIGVTGTSNEWTPALHSTRWSGVSDWQVGMHHGVLWMEPDGSDDPYEFADFDAAGTPGFPGKVTDR